MQRRLIELPIATTDGIFTARYSERGLAGLNFPKKTAAKRPAGQTESAPEPLPAKIEGWHRRTTTALTAVLAGRKAGKLPPLDWDGKTDFQKAVWGKMLKLAPGETLSYGEIARAIGRPQAVRAVGGACGANPIPVLVPCHRVLAANKKIGGFSGGLDWKQTLLEREGVKL